MNFQILLKKKYYFDKSISANYVGLLLPSNKSSKKPITFKIKDIEDIKTKSAVCNNFNILTRTKILKYCFGKEKYEKHEKKIKSLNSYTMCLLIEFILRYNNLNKVNEKKWFLNSEESIYNKNNHKILKF